MVAALRLHCVDQAMERITEAALFYAVHDEGDGIPMTKLSWDFINKGRNCYSLV
ncbi:hypothetical protein Sjap_000520 [Stephania japonica]|uniref:Uncharacterized protein n=1 Tax=Stephania japonica TaxID=461633 RepID=A0AAP0PSI6_9MAGN